MHSSLLVTFATRALAHLWSQHGMAMSVTTIFVCFRFDLTIWSAFQGRRSSLGTVLAPQNCAAPKTKGRASFADFKLGRNGLNATKDVRAGFKCPRKSSGL